LKREKRHPHALGGGEVKFKGGKVSKLKFGGNGGWEVDRGKGEIFKFFEKP